MSDPLRELIETALELMNHSFAPPGDIASAKMEFYHQFRKLWDRGIPVGMGLGHLLMKAEGEFLAIERIGEKGIAGEQLALIAFGAGLFPAEECGNNIRIKPFENRWIVQS